MLKIQTILNSKQRNSSVDVFRGIAIILVVLYHFNDLIPFGYIGVDLFFVISGLLVGGILVKRLKSNESISFPKFILQRGFKIWPSYFLFLLLGIPLAHIFYSKTNPSQILSMSELPKYVFFYKNYQLKPDHLVFDQVWSLCVEEHFYILLPILFIIINKVKRQKELLISSIIIVILLGILFKYLGNHATSFGTHARLDALAWGVLLSILVVYYPLKIKKQYLISLTGFALLVTLLILKSYHSSFFYERVVYHSLLPIAFAAMLWGGYNYDLANLKVLRYVGYYSYNWYLWHPMFHIIIVNYFGAGFIPLLMYLAITFCIAILLTITVEERILSYRSTVTAAIFKTSS